MGYSSGVSNEQARRDEKGELSRIGLTENMYDRIIHP
jgi:hypothetical protein